MIEKWLFNEISHCAKFYNSVVGETGETEFHSEATVYMPAYENIRYELYCELNVI